MMTFVVDKAAQRLNNYLGIGFAVGVLFALYQVVTETDLASAIFMGVWTVGGSFVVSKILKQPNVVEFDQLKGEIHFTNPISTSVQPVMELDKIKSENTVLTFSFGSVEIEMPNQITGLHKLIEEIKKVNSNVEITGC